MARPRQPPVPDEPARSLPPAQVVFTPAFALVFFTVLGLTILSLVASMVLVLREKQTDQIKNLAETTSTTYKMGFAAIIGLIGGKAL